MIASNWHQNDQNFWVRWQNYKSNQITMDCIDFTSKRSKTLSYVAKLQKSSNYNELHWFDVKRIENNELHRFDVKKSKERKTTKLRRKTFKTTQNYESDHITIIASIWRPNHQNFWVRWQNYKSNQITMNCIDLMSKR